MPKLTLRAEDRKYNYTRPAFNVGIALAPAVKGWGVGSIRFRIVSVTGDSFQIKTDHGVQSEIPIVSLGTMMREKTLVVVR